MNTKGYDNQINEWIQGFLTDSGFNAYGASVVNAAFWAICVLMLSYLTSKVTKYYILKVVEKIIRKTKSKYDDYLIDRKVFQRLSLLAPAIVIYLLSGFVFHDFPVAGGVVRNGALIYLVLVFMWTLNALLNVVQDIYNNLPFAKERPIKGYIQVVQIVVYFLLSLVVISIIFDKNLTALFTGLGAVAAILLLIFKDTILGLVAGIQLAANKMVRVGDWISMPSHNADGTVLEITLNTVKIQNWDQTISTVPTYALVSESFTNWRGMEESGGRRIKRAINIDMKSVKFCSPEMLAKYRKIHLLKDYIEQKDAEIINYNKSLEVDESVSVNGRRMTNLGVFRHYLEAYLQNHPKIHNHMTFLIRHLEPSEKGLPIEIYVFSKDQEWANYEAIQADIFDHVLAVIQEFELQVFQFPTGSDLKPLLGD